MASAAAQKLATNWTGGATACRAIHTVRQECVSTTIYASSVTMLEAGTEQSTTRAFKFQTCICGDVSCPDWEYGVGKMGWMSMSMVRILCRETEGMMAEPGKEWKGWN